MNADSKTKRVVLCADDFGMSPGIDTGIIRLAAQGRLSAASCLARGPTFASHAPALAATGVQVGLHLNFTERLGPPEAERGAAGRRPGDQASPVREPYAAPTGLYLPLSVLIRRAYLRRLDGRVLRAQIQDQLDGFETAFGRPPDFVDGHQHVHQLPQIRQALLDTLQRRYRGMALPWLRSTRAISLDGTPAGHRRKAAIIQALGAAALARRANRAGFGLNARFAGVYDFRGGEAAYRALLSEWLRRIGDGDVLMCHPAAQADASDPLGPQRVAEFNVLSADETGRWLQQYGIQPRRAGFGRSA